MKLKDKDSEVKLIKIPGTWQCYKCGYAMTDTEIKSLKYDVGCPRCGESLAGFSYTEED